MALFSAALLGEPYVDPTEVILTETKCHNSDLIVLGAHEHGINHTFLGTTAKRVLRRTDIPSLIVPSRSAASS